MSFIENVKKSVIARVAERVAILIVLVIAWVASAIAPVVGRVIMDSLSKEGIVTLLLASLAINCVLLIVVWAVYKGPEFRLKYGIYWDKDLNPHCPSCKIPVGGYGEYTGGGKGYYCKPCGKVFSLTDPHGKHIDPQTVLDELAN